MGLLISSWKLLQGLVILLVFSGLNTAAGQNLVYSITLLRTWEDAIAERQCEEVGYLNIICQEVQGQVGDRLSVQFNFLGVVPTLSSQTSMLLNTTTHNVTHSAGVLQALQALVSTGRVRTLPVAPSVIVFPHPQIDLAVLMVNPRSGPRSGGTRVTIIGVLPPDMDVYIGDQECESQFRTLVLHICPTPAFNTSLDDTQLDITLQDGDSTTRSSNFTYTYTVDPTITMVQPLKVILSGGMNLTVSGSNLNTALSRMLHTMVEPTGGTQSTLYKTECRGSSATEMICPTPPISLGDISQTRRRKRRQVDSVNDQEMLDIQILFVLDGVLQEPTGFTTLEVYEDPVLLPFDPPSFTQTLTGTTLTIQGQRLLAALTMSDYTVTVGGQSCTNIKVMSEQIECDPPDTQPQMDDESNVGPSGIPVIVHYVDRVSEVGFLEYSNNNLRHILIGVGVVLSCLIILLVAVGVCCYIQRSKKESTLDPELTTYTKPKHETFNKPWTFRKAAFGNKGEGQGGLSRAEFQNVRGRWSRHHPRGNDDQNQYGHRGQYDRHDQYGHRDQYGRQNQNGRQDDQRPSRQVWPGGSHSGNSPGSTAAYVPRATADSIRQHGQRARLPTPRRMLHAAAWNWENHA